MNTIQELEKISPENLHYIYGANCFQHAIGYALPLFSRKRAHGLEFVRYFKLQPGGIYAGDPSAEVSLENFNKKILDYCVEEGLTVCKDRAVTRDGYRTLALFTSVREGIYDFHFAFYNEKGLWESKIPFQNPNQFHKVSDAGLGYNFYSYLLAPVGLLPKAVSEWVPKMVQVRSPAGKIIQLQEVDANTPGYQFVNDLIFDCQKGLSFLINDKALLPLPPWPPLVVPTAAPRQEAKANP